MSFKTGYQGGPYFELFSTQGRDFMANWKGSSSGIKKTYEKDVKGYVLTLEGAPATTKLQSPKDQKQSLTLVQRFVVLQVYLSKGADFSLELGVTDLGNNKRRILLSTAQKETQVTPLHAKVPLSIVRRAVWLNLVLDMVSLTGETWTSQTFRSVDHISVSANCKLRRVFTMRSQPPDTTDDDELYGCSPTNSGEIDNIPKQCQMAPDVTQLTQVLTLNKIKSAERLKSGKGPGLAEQFRPGSTLDLDLNASGRKVHTSDGKIAFGSKAPRAPESGRKTARPNQGSITNRSFRSQTSRNDANSSTGVSGTADSIYSHDGLGPGVDHFDISKPRPPASASAVSSVSGLSSSATSCNRQQSEPVTQEDFGYIANGLKDKQIVVPHPPREPSTDRVRRRPRIKSIGQNGVLNKGDSSVSSPPTSAMPGQIGSRGAMGQMSTHSPGSTCTGQTSGEARVSHNRMRDSGVGPDVPEIQSPRKGDVHNPSDSSVFTVNDSVADVISLLRDVNAKIEEDLGDSFSTSNANTNNNNSYINSSKPRRNEEENREKENKRKEMGRIDGWKELEMNGKENARGDDDDDKSSTSASESSHPGEYEESDEETSGEKNKLHFFVSPPKSASIRRNVSPSTTDLDSNQSKRGSVKSFRSNVKRNTDTSSNRGARLEDDFVSHSSSDDDPAAAADLMPHNLRARRPMGGAGSGMYRHSCHHHSSNSSGYHSNNYTSSATSSPKSRGQLDRSGVNRSRPAPNMTPQTSVSPDQKPTTFDPRLYSDTEVKGRDSVLNSVSRMNRKSLREINNPHNESSAMTSSSNDKPYDFTKYQVDDLSESDAARMFASMRRQGEETLEDASPPPSQSTQALRNSQHHLNPADTMMTHLYSDSPATTSDDDTSFSTWKAPAQNQAPHNYQDEMKSRRSSDTLTSSNARDWSGVMSPPIVPLSGVKDLQGTMEGISDDLSDEPTANQVQSQPSLKSGEEEEKLLDLYFDPKLNCYFDPKSKKWYELVS